MNLMVVLSMLVACGGGGNKQGQAEDPKAAKRAAKAEKKAAKEAKKGKKGKGPKKPAPAEPEPEPIKIRAPFFTMPESIAKGVVGGDTGRDLLVPIQKGPFGPGTTLTLLYRQMIEPEGSEPFPGVGLMVVVQEGEQQAGYQLPVVNEAPLANTPTLEWVNAPQGWQPVVMIQRRKEDGEAVQDNQAFSWDGTAFVHAEEEPRIASMTDPDALQEHFY